MNVTIKAEGVVSGSGIGKFLLLNEPLSFWGGYDSEAGHIIDKKHPQFGMPLAGTVMFMERAKGSSSSSSVLAEAIRNGHGPAAIVMLDRDLIVGLGCIVASELYGIHVPVVILGKGDWDRILKAGEGGAFHVRADAFNDGTARIAIDFDKH